ncbi:MAG: gamma carbonic anhydrase family protein [Bacteroidota bacterium]|nr:gamma carbonic anhydrase family protein [Bacteroidota bacterium]
MSIIKALRGFTPKFGENCFIAENAAIIGEVEMGNNCSIWYNAVLRGDVHYIKIGNNVNIQDCTVIHGTYKTSPTNIGNNVTVGHNAVLHGCTIEDFVLVGMGAVVLDNAILRENSLIAAGSVVLANTVIESGWIYAGAPAKKVKQMPMDKIHDIIKNYADNYMMYTEWYK